MPRDPSWTGGEVLNETENKPLELRAIRTGDDALGYTAMTRAARAHGSLTTPKIPSEDGGEEGLSVRQVSIAVCGILTLLSVAICCGVGLGLLLSTRATIQVPKSSRIHDAHHHYLASMVHANDADLIRANGSGASVPVDSVDNVRGTTATQRPQLEQSSLPRSVDKPDTSLETTSRPLAVIAAGSTTTSTVATTSRTSTSTQSSSSTRRRSTSMLSTAAQLPSLFCFSIMRCKSYEVSLVRMQLAKGLGIFGCNGYSVFSDETTWLTTGSPMQINSTVLGVRLQAHDMKEHIPNKELFLRAWEQVKANGLYRQHDWIVKVDPDAVFFPQRLGARLLKITAESAGVSLYLLNCRLSFGLGALEIMSRVALLTFYDGLERCQQVLPWRSFSEDMFLRKCLDFLGVAPHKDFSLLSDPYCGEQLSPCSSWKVAFHPFKSVQTYLKCMHEASD